MGLALVKITRHEDPRAMLPFACGCTPDEMFVRGGSLLAKRSLLLQRFAPPAEVTIWRPAAQPQAGEQEQGPGAAGVHDALRGVVEECGEWMARVRLVQQRDTILRVPLEHLSLSSGS